MTSTSTSTELPANATEQAARGFLDRIRTAFDILRLRTAAVDACLADEGAFIAAVAIVGLAGVAGAVAAGAGVGGHLASVLAYVLVSVVYAAAVHLGATVIADGDGDFIAFYRALGHTYLALWITGIPLIQAFFTWALWLWQLAAIVLIAERVYRLERAKAVAVVGVPAAVGLFLALLFNGLIAMKALLAGWLF